LLAVYRAQQKRKQPPTPPTPPPDPTQRRSTVIQVGSPGAPITPRHVDGSALERKSGTSHRLRRQSGEEAYLERQDYWADERQWFLENGYTSDGGKRIDLPEGPPVILKWFPISERESEIPRGRLLIELRGYDPDQFLPL
jgi:hypothetical protein